MAVPVGSALKSPIIIIFSCSDDNRSRLLPIPSKYSDIADFFGLCEQQIIHFYFLKLIATKNPSIVILVGNNFEGISS